MTIHRLRWTWNGGTGLPGYTNFYCNSALSQPFADATKTFLSACLSGGAIARFPQNVTITPDAYVDVLDEATGTLQSTVPITPPAQLLGAAAGPYAAGVGACITWITDGINENGHRIRGRTFLVPLLSSKYGSDGTLDDTMRSEMITAAGAYLTDPCNPIIWERPSGPGASDGRSHEITASSVKDRAAQLRSRRR